MGFKRMGGRCVAPAQRRPVRTGREEFAFRCRPYRYHGCASNLTRHKERCKGRSHTRTVTISSASPPRVSSSALWQADEPRPRCAQSCRCLEHGPQTCRQSSQHPSLGVYGHLVQWPDVRLRFHRSTESNPRLFLLLNLSLPTTLFRDPTLTCPRLDRPFKRVAGTLMCSNSHRRCSCSQQLLVSYSPLYSCPIRVFLLLLSSPIFDAPVLESSEPRPRSKPQILVCVGPCHLCC